GAPAVGVLVLALAAQTDAQVPANVLAQLKKIGPVVDPAATAAIYRPLHGAAATPGVRVTRNVLFGPNPKNVIDVFTADAGSSPRTVLVFVSGSGDRIERMPNGDAFYDNIMLWAVKNGMTGVNMQRRSSEGIGWDDPAIDVRTLVRWLQRNVGRFKG